MTNQETSTGNTPQHQLTMHSAAVPFQQAVRGHRSPHRRCGAGPRAAHAGPARRVVSARQLIGLAAGGTAGALLSAELAGAEAAGLPTGALVVGQALAALLVADRTQPLGRGKSLALGYALGALGAALVIAAAVAQNLAALLLGSAVLGGGNAAVFLTRYAAAEIGDGAARGRGLGVVLFAAALGAVASPNLLGPSGAVADRFGLPPLTGLYLVALVCFGVAALFLLLAATPGVPYVGQGAAWLGPRRGSSVGGRDLVSGANRPPARAALAVLAVTNLVMVAVMAMAPVHLVTHGHSLQHVGFIVSLHVAGMFAPSPLSGWAADRFGGERVAASGIALRPGGGSRGAHGQRGGPFDDLRAPPARRRLELWGGGGQRAARHVRPGGAQAAGRGRRGDGDGGGGGSGHAAGWSAGRARRLPGALSGWCRGGGAGVRSVSPKRFCAWSTG